MAAIAVMFDGKESYVESLLRVLQSREAFCE